MKVFWTENAIGHLANIYEYIGQNSQTYAARMVDRITRRSEQIAHLPESGRRVPEYDAKEVRELIEKPYRIIYRIKPEQIDILVKLQKIELETNHVNSQIGELPHKIKRIDQELLAFQDTIAEEEYRLTELKKKYRTFESDAEMNLSRIKKSKEKLGSVKTNKEYQSS